MNRIFCYKIFTFYPESCSGRREVVLDYFPYSWYSLQLEQLNSHSAFHENSLETARITARIVAKTAEAAAEQAALAEAAALEQTMNVILKDRAEAVAALEEILLLQKQ